MSRSRKHGKIRLDAAGPATPAAARQPVDTDPASLALLGLQPKLASHEPAARLAAYKALQTLVADPDVDFWPIQEELLVGVFRSLCIGLRADGLDIGAPSATDSSCAAAGARAVELLVHRMGVTDVMLEQLVTSLADVIEARSRHHDWGLLVPLCRAAFAMDYCQRYYNLGTSNFCKLWTVAVNLLCPTSAAPEPVQAAMLRLIACLAVGVPPEDHGRGPYGSDVPAAAAMEHCKAILSTSLLIRTNDLLRASACAAVIACRALDKAGGQEMSETILQPHLIFLVAQLVVHEADLYVADASLFVLRRISDMLQKADLEARLTFVTGLWVTTKNLQLGQRVPNTNILTNVMALISQLPDLDKNEDNEKYAVSAYLGWEPISTLSNVIAAMPKHHCIPSIIHHGIGSLYIILHFAAATNSATITPLDRSVLVSHISIFMLGLSVALMRVEQYALACSLDDPGEMMAILWENGDLDSVTAISFDLIPVYVNVLMAAVKASGPETPLYSLAVRHSHLGHHTFLGLMFQVARFRLASSETSNQAVVDLCAQICSWASSTRDQSFMTADVGLLIIMLLKILARCVPEGEPFDLPHGDSWCGARCILFVLRALSKTLPWTQEEVTAGLVSDHIGLVAAVAMRGMHFATMKKSTEAIAYRLIMPVSIIITQAARYGSAGSTRRRLLLEHCFPVLAHANSQMLISDAAADKDVCRRTMEAAASALLQLLIVQHSDEGRGAKAAALRDMASRLPGRVHIEGGKMTWKLPTM